MRTTGAVNASRRRVITPPKGVSVDHRSTPARPSSAPTRGLRPRHEPPAVAPRPPAPPSSPLTPPPATHASPPRPSPTPPADRSTRPPPERRRPRRRGRRPGRGRGRLARSARRPDRATPALGHRAGRRPVCRRRDRRPARGRLDQIVEPVARLAEHRVRRVGSVGSVVATGRVRRPPDAAREDGRHHPVGAGDRVVARPNGRGAGQPVAGGARTDRVGRSAKPLATGADREVWRRRVVAIPPRWDPTADQASSTSRSPVDGGDATPGSRSGRSPLTSRRRATVTSPFP